MPTKEAVNRISDSLALCRSFGSGKHDMCPYRHYNNYCSSMLMIHAAKAIEDLLMLKGTAWTQEIEETLDALWCCGAGIEAKDAAERRCSGCPMKEKYESVYVCQTVLLEQALHVIEALREAAGW